MVTRNYDSMRNYQLFKISNLAIQEHEGIYLQTITGDYSTSLSTTPVPFINWVDSYYTNYNFQGSSGTVLWIGGNSKQNAPNSAVSPINENYNDYNLYRPFRGGADENTEDAEVIAQNTKIGDPYYDKTDKKWKREILREFKNVSGRTLEVSEIGIYYNLTSWCLVAREIFRNKETGVPEAIIVENECYFKVGYTLNCEDLFPNENMRRFRKWKNSKEVQSYYTWGQMSGTQGNTMKFDFSSGIHTFYFLIGSGNGGSTISNGNNRLSFLGWREKDGEDFVLEGEKLSTIIPSGTFFGEALGYYTGKEGALSFSKTFSGNQNNPSNMYSIEIDSDCLEEEPFTVLSCSVISGEKATVTKSAEETNILWLVRGIPVNGQKNARIVNEDANCDTIVATVLKGYHDNYHNPPYTSQGIIFVDCSNVTEHTFFLPDQTGYVVYKIQVNTKIDPLTGEPIPLYYDVNLESDA